jgi:glycine/D-amino acid oxidase-like deaminating enzyme/nitrite reductase/ring-hydroxylating ferredoxin subunit
LRTTKAPPGKAECCWTAAAPQTGYPRLQGRHSFDVAVVGGGIVGLTAALQLAQTGRRVAVLEARRIGRQVTGRSTAKITVQHGLIYRYLIDTIGVEKARLYADANQAALRHIERLIADHAVDCDFEPKDAYVYIGPHSDRRQQLDQEAEAARRVGLDAEVLATAPLPFATGGALRFPQQAQFNPAKYLIGIASLAARAGVSVFEETRIKAIDPGSRWRVQADGAEITANDVIVATNSPLPGPQDFDRSVQPRCHLAMGFSIEPDDAPNGMFIAGEEPFHSIRTGNDGTGLVLVVLGPRFKTGQEGDIAGQFWRLENWVRENFRIRHVGWRWSNEDMDTADRLAFAGPVPKRDSGLYVATGFNAWGITNGTAAGILLADQIVGQPNPWAVLFDPARPYPQSFNRAGSTATPIASIAGLAKGAGGIIEQDGEKIAVWRDDNGEVHAMSAKCSHKGCLVTWNNADRTWDCPCHGSIFASDGSVIHGPAVEPLAARSIGRSKER